MGPVPQISDIFFYFWIIYIRIVPKSKHEFIYDSYTPYTHSLKAILHTNFNTLYMKNEVPSMEFSTCGVTPALKLSESFTCAFRCSIRFSLIITKAHWRVPHWISPLMLPVSFGCSGYPSADPTEYFQVNILYTDCLLSYQQIQGVGSFPLCLH